MRPLDLSGQRFGRLIALNPQPGCSASKRAWACACDCGGSVTVPTDALRRGGTRSCGCFKREVAAATAKRRNTVHGHNTLAVKSPTWRSWRAMHQRCRQASHRSFPDYGGRGITICARWSSFENFLADMGERSDDLTLDRIDVNGNYEASNCRWATRSEQQRNKRGLRHA